MVSRSFGPGDLSREKEREGKARAHRLFLFLCLVDCRNRMKGLTVLYAPGYDHAGISTQSVVEKRLWKDEKLTKHDLGREKFLEKVMIWKDE